MSALLLMLPLRSRPHRHDQAPWRGQVEAAAPELRLCSGILAVIHYLMFSKLISISRSPSPSCWAAARYRLAAKFG